MTSLTNIQGSASPVSNMTSPPSAGARHQRSANHQQDLIRLLAQHFNQQVYQLAGADNELVGQVGPTSSGVSNIDLLHQSIASLQQQQQRSHYQPDQNPTSSFLPISRRVESTTANLLESNRASNNQAFLGHLNRSQASPATLNSLPKTHAVATNGGRQADLTPMPDGGAECQAPLLDPLLNDMNLFNALSGFNMANDQFMFSIQQQYLLQAASAAGRQFAYKHPNLIGPAGMEAGHQQPHFSRLMQHQANLIHQQQRQQQPISQQQQQHELLANQSQARRANQATDLLVGKKVGGADSNTHHPPDDGRELLKFSINTILGRVSPAAPGEQVVMSEMRSPEGAQVRRESIDCGSSLQISSLQAYDRSANVQSSSPDCDPNILTDLSSDSSSPNLLLNAQRSDEPQLPFEQFQASRGAAAELNQRASSLANQVARYHQAAAAAASVAEQQQRSAAALASQHQSQQQSSLTILAAGSTAFPWTTAARGKPRRGMMRRAVFSDSQRVGLEKRFQLQKYISKPDRKKLAEKLGLRDSQVKIWFQNRRMKWRNSKERELLSAGGSREQTLPTRNNPNPDLSDVGETIKKISSTSSDNGTTT